MKTENKIIVLLASLAILTIIYHMYILHTQKSSPVSVVATQDHVGGEEKMTFNSNTVSLGEPPVIEFNGNELFIQSKPKQKIFIITTVTTTNLIWPKQ